MWDGDSHVHLGAPEAFLVITYKGGVLNLWMFWVFCVTWNDLTELNNADESFAAVTGREHEDNGHENGGNEDVPL